MFEKLRRAKSFIGRTKPRQELDLPETSHLRRTIPINSQVLFGVTDETLRQNVGTQGTNHHVDGKKSNNKTHNRDLEDSVRSSVNPEDITINHQFKRLTLQEKRDTIDRKQVSGFNKSRQETTGKKVSRSKSARETRSQFVKKFPNKYILDEEM